MSPGILHSSAIKEFLAECQDQLERMTLLVTPHSDGKESRTAEECLHALNRELHTMKGNAQLFGYTQLASLAHALESSVEFSRKKGESIGPELSDEIFRGLGLLERIVGSINSLGHEGSHESLVAKLVSAISENVARRMQTPAGVGAKTLTPESETPKPKASDTPTKEVAQTEDDKTPTPKADLEVVKVTPTAPSPSESIKVTSDKPSQEPKAAPPAPDSSQDSLRVQVSLLDSLMNFVGELVLVRNQVIQKANQQSDDAEFNMLSQRLDVITNELQNEVMKTRMQPIGNILTKFHRLTRDMARDLNKDIQLKLEGTETELDKTLIEAVKDPLTHIIRNSMDHGLENKEDRALTKKPKTGTVTIRAYHEGGQIVIEVQDDGRGLQRERIARKALEKGLITPEQLRKYSDKDICNLIFLPGFSTAEKVSNISGRGVGMDVVRTNIEKIGGVVDVQSIEGQGSTIRLKIPLTLAIVPALLVKTKGQRFAIPQVKLMELVCITKDQASEHDTENRIEYLQGRPVFRLRGSLLPVVSLAETLGLTGATKEDLREKAEINVVVLQLDSGLFALIVDEIDDSVDIVVKSLSGLLKSLNVYSGATVLGDGHVALVLDVVGLAAKGQAFHDKREADKTEEDEPTSASDEVTEYLLVDIGVDGRYCIPLFVISRLEELSRDLLEYTGDQVVVRYRNSILPLLPLSEDLGGPSRLSLKDLKNNPKCSVIVIQQAEKLYGLVVEKILDIVGIGGPVDDQIRDKDALLGTVVHQNHIISVIDVFHSIGKHFPLSKASRESGAKEKHPPRVLYAEDSPFFQKQITALLESHGLVVTPVSNGEEAFDRLMKEGRGAFDVLVSDLDMPLLDGFGFIEKVRLEEAFRDLPAYALSSRAKSLTEKIAVDAGFHAYVEKSDIARLVTYILQHGQEKTDEDLVMVSEVRRGA